MKAEYVNAFLEPAVSVIKKVLKVKVTIGEITKAVTVNARDAFSVIIGLSGDLSGVVIIGFSMKTARNIAAKMLCKDKLTDLNIDAKEALSELVNMIVGNATGNLYDLGLKELLTPPTIVLGSKVSYELSSSDQLTIISIKTGLGIVDMNIFFKDERIV